MRVDVDDSDNTMGAKIRNHSCTRSPTCWSSATTKPRAAPSLSGLAAAKRRRDVTVEDFVGDISDEIESTRSSS